MNSNTEVMAARGRRPTSGPWGRLKPVNVDALEDMGLPSKGDKRLLDFKTQEKYHTKIIDRYMSFCSAAGRGDELLRRLSSLTINSSSPHEPAVATHNLPALARASTASASLPSTTAALTSASSEIVDLATEISQNDLSTLMLSLRKLREGIVASKRVDDFAIQSYIFCIRLSILTKNMESYHPAISHLLRIMHPRKPLTRILLQEIAGYLVLDLACRQQDLAAAYAARQKYGLRDKKVDAVLKALAHDNYYLFWKVKGSVDSHKARLMEFAEGEMRRQALKCLGRTYLHVDVGFFEECVGTGWERCVREEGVGWLREGDQVVIRKPKGK